VYLNIILNFFILLIQIANCLNCKGKRQKKEFKKIFVKKIFPNNRTGYTFCAGYTYCAHCTHSTVVSHNAGVFLPLYPTPQQNLMRCTVSHYTEAFSVLYPTPENKNFFIKNKT
jgi:hypothetical protein